jgi:uncharacterized protein YcbX
MSAPDVVGHVAAIFRYPIKSMAGEALEAAEIGWYGVDGDRRYAFRRVEERGGNPWLTASKLPELLRFVPQVPAHVRTPEGDELAIGPALDADVSRRYGQPVELLRLHHGIFDESSVSVVTQSTVDELGRAVGRDLDVRRFRPNLLIRTVAPRGYEEDAWVGRTLEIGDLVLGIQMRDERCAMLGLDPDTAEPDPQILKTVVRLHDNLAGVYATVISTGRVSVGDAVRIR